MSQDFVHLHVASGYSMQYGASPPSALVERAAELGQQALALTDRDGLYGAVKFVQACTAACVAPILGVDLAVRPGLRPGGAAGRTPARGGAYVDPRLPRVTVLARGQDSAAAGAGWARLCRLVTAVHLAGERGRPQASAEQLAEHLIDPATGRQALVVLLGPDSDVGRAVLARRPAQALRLLQRWQTLLPDPALAIEIVCHGGPATTPGSRGQAMRMLELAEHAGVPSVLSAAVRHAEPGGAMTADLLDAARRLVALDTRHLDRTTTAGHLAGAADMAAIAQDVAGDPARAQALLHRTAVLATQCVQDARTDLGIGSVQLPEPEILGLSADQDPQQVLTARCLAAIGDRYPGARDAQRSAVEARLRQELAVIDALGYPTYFLTVATVCDLIREHGGRVAARGSGAGSLVNHLLGISGVDPMRYDLLMERFCSPLRAQLPDIDVDVESDKRTTIYEHILDRFGADRVTCVSMMDTYKVRHAIRDVGAAIGMAPIEIDAIAKAFPHIWARDARNAIRELPELRASGLDAPRLDLVFDLVERLDGLPRHIALHPCGVVLSNAALLDRSPVEASWLGFPMSQFDKDDVEVMGLLKLDVLGIRMQSAMAHAVAEVERVDGVRIDLDDREQVPLDDEATFRLIRTTHTLGCFQIESPGQRELIGKFGPERFEDLIIDISLFRPGPVKSDMITPFLLARHQWRPMEYLHPTLIPALQETAGVVVFHEQVLRIVAITTGASLAQADEVRRAMGSPAGQAEVEKWWRPAAVARGYAPAEIERIWQVLVSFASFGFCKAHAAAFALPTYQSAWLKTHHPAAFLAGVLTHDPGMYPKRLILDDARNLGIAILSLDVNASTDSYRIEKVAPWDEPPPRILDQLPGGPRPRDLADPSTDGDPSPRQAPAHPDLPDGRAYGIRLSLTDVHGISEAEVQRIVAGQPYAGLADFWNRAAPSRPVTERLVLAGAFDSLYGLSGHAGPGRRGKVTRRDLLLHVAELDRYGRALAAGARRATAGRAAGGPRRLSGSGVRRGVTPAPQLTDAGTPSGGGGLWADTAGVPRFDVRAASAAQSQAARAATPATAQSVQLTLDLGDAPELTQATGLPELTEAERVAAELDVLGLDASSHVLTAYSSMLDALGAVRARDLLRCRSRSEVLVAGVKVATQTPPVRSGRRVVFVTVDDSTGPVDATFFEDVQGPYAGTVFHSWLLVIRGEVRRTGSRGLSLRATGAWELGSLWQHWRAGGVDAVHAAIAASDVEAAAQRETADAVAQVGVGQAGRRVLRYASGFAQSPYADTTPVGTAPRSGRGLAGQADPIVAPRKLWHASPGSSGH